MARKTKSHKNAAAAKKTTQKTRSQKANSKPKTPQRPRKNTSTPKRNAAKNVPKNSQKKEDSATERMSLRNKQPQNAVASNKCQPNVSPPIFDNPLLQTYKGLEYTSKSCDSFESCASSLVVVDGSFNGSRDLFETESMEEKTKVKSPVKMVSIGIQCMLINETQDVSVGTEEKQLRDSGIQTSPQPSTFDIYTSVQSVEEEDLFESCSSDESDSDGDSSDHTLRDFDMLENYEDPIVSVTRFNSLQPDVTDELESRISDSPPQNRIYANKKFHSPESSQLNKVKSV